MAKQEISFEKFIDNIKDVQRVPKNKLRAAHLLEWASSEECLINNKLLENINILDIEEAIEQASLFENGERKSDNILNNMVTTKSLKVMIEALKGTQECTDDEDFF